MDGADIIAAIITKAEGIEKSNRAITPDEVKTLKAASFLRILTGETSMATTTNEEKKPSLAPNWSCKCENCGQTPTVGKSRLCGPCYFGEADMAGGNW